MTLPVYQLFLGFPVDENLSKMLDSLDEGIKSLFFQDNEQYLQSVAHKDLLYIGKFVGVKSDMQTLHSLEENIYSILRRVAPNFPYKETPLRLFPIEYKRK